MNHLDQICTIPASNHDCLPCVLRNTRSGAVFYKVFRFVPTDMRIRTGILISKLPFIPFITPWLISSLSIQEKESEWKSIIEHATMLIAPSEAIQVAMIRNGANPGKVKIVQHGISLHDKEPLNERIAQRPIRFLYVGRINRVKGLHILLDAFDRLRTTAVLTIVGDAFTREEIRYKRILLRQFKSKNIVWLGHFDNNDIGQHLRHNDVMVHPAICLEVFGLSIAEALSSGRPVIATRCGGPEMQVEDEVNGYLVPPNNATTLSEKMQYLIDHPEEIIRLSNNIQQPLSIQEHVARLIEIYNSVKGKDK